MNYNFWMRIPKSDYFIQMIFDENRCGIYLDAAPLYTLSSEERSFDLEELKFKVSMLKMQNTMVQFFDSQINLCSESKFWEILYNQVSDAS